MQLKNLQPSAIKLIRFCLGIGLVGYIVLLLLMPVRQKPIQSQDAIVVLGTIPLDAYGQIHPCLQSRVLRAAEIYHQNPHTSRVILTGGDEASLGKSEAEVMRQIAIEHGIPDEIILLEHLATSTYENLAYSKQLMSANNLEKAVIVTEPFHARRAGLVAKRLGYDYQIVYTQTNCRKGFDQIWVAYVREPIALAYYILLGWYKPWQTKTSQL